MTHVVDVGVGVGIGVCAKHNQRRRGIFVDGGVWREKVDKWRDVTIVREKEDRNWVWIGRSASQ